MSPPTTCAAIPSATSSPASACGRTPFAAPDGPMTARSGQAPARASLSARQARKLDLLTSGTYGPPSSGSSLSADLQSSLESRLRARLSSLGSTLYTLTWKPWVTPSGVSRSRLRASALRTSVTGSTGWPTPAATDYKGGVSGWSDSQREALDGSSVRLRTAWGLADAHGLRCEPAPGAGLRPDAEHDSESLGGAVRLGYAGQQPGQRDAGGFPGAQASEHGARLSVDGGVPQRSEYAGAGVGPGPGPVNGRWRAADWLCCRDGKWRPVEPGTFPLADGAPSRVVRLRAYGNAINAEAAVEFICAYEEARTRVGRVPEPDLDDEFLGLI